MSLIIKYSDMGDYKNLFCDFVYSSDNIQSLFPANSLSDAIAKIDRCQYHRDLAVDILTHQNKNWQAPDKVLSQIQKLSDGKSLTVFTGQQACLLGGPYLVLLKALTTIAEAHRLEEELKRPVVPVFWIAADDHDFEEISEAHVFNSQGKLTKLQLDVDANRQYSPVGTLDFGNDIKREVNRLFDSLGNATRFDDIAGIVKSIYTPGKSIVDAFAEILLKLVGHLGLVCFSPYDREFKSAVSDVMVAIVEKNREIKEILERRNQLLAEQGYHIQVKKSDSAVYLFQHQPEREAIHVMGDKYKAGDREYSKTELVEKIKADPLGYSPDVLARLLVQSSFFPAVEIIGGPAEIAYWAQMIPLFDLFDLPAPHIKERMSSTVLESFVAGFMESNDVNYKAVIGNIEQVISERLEESFPSELTGLIPLAKKRTAADMDSLREKLLQFDPGLEGMINKTGIALDRELSQLEKKLFAAHKKKNKAERDKYYMLREHLYPGGKVAERVISPVYFLARYGLGWIDWLFTQLDIEARGHQLIDMKSYHG